MNLILSTGDPNTDNNKPDVDTKYLNFINPNSYRATARATKSYNYKYNPNVRTVSGTVYDDSGLPLPGANVIVKGTGTGAQTDFDGRFSLDVGSGSALQFSYVGYRSEEIPVHASNVTIHLEADNQLDEVVVTAYGFKREKSSLGYAVSEISSEEDVARALSGKASGVKIRGNATATGQAKIEAITTTRFEIAKPYSIPTDGDVTVIEVDKFMVPATYEYFAAPVLNENVFLTAKIKDWEQFSLLPGEANIYFEGSFAGKTYINPLATTEALTISLGTDPNVIVKRKQLDNFKDRSFIGNTKIVKNTYTTTLKNTKSKAITIKMMDRIPISQNKEIKVVDEDTPGATYDDKTGIATWDLTLQPQESTTKRTTYTLRYPKFKTINL